ncbi:LytR/AlgR family response regulator transcription factor [Aquiflexum sp.]|uniref:LytR/AlgR family response regulator transcription factor n=1 Tax=Aquiflexum sp. TaxID=1872584 RepID=UPI003593B4C9
MEIKSVNDQKNDYRPDLLIFLIAIPIISAINFHLTYSNIQLNLFFLTRFLIDTIQGYFAWLIVRLLIISLDKKIPYEPKPLYRILIQTIVTTISGLFFIASTTEILSLIVKNEWAPLNFYTQDLLIISIWFLVINGFYVGMYFYRQWEMNLSASKSEGLIQEGIAVKSGNQNLLIRFDEILIFEVEIDYVILRDVSGKKYFLDLSLDKIEKKVPPIIFFRINRQVLAHRQVIKGFKKIENGKLLVQLIQTLDIANDLTISRTKAAAFRSWFLPQ